MNNPKIHRRHEVVPPKTFKKWKLKKEHGDAALITKTCTADYQAVLKVMKYGVGPATIIDAINKFYGIENKSAE